MAWPVVSVASGGLPVTLATNGYGTPYEIAANGYGTPVTFVASGGLPVVEGVGVPALAWRFSNGTPVRREAGGYWLRAT